MRASWRAAAHDLTHQQARAQGNGAPVRALPLPSQNVLARRKDQPAI